MGKSGKLRKKRRLESAVSQSALGGYSSSDDEGGSGAGKVAVDPLCPQRIDNAMACLLYFGHNFDQYQSADNKIVRTALFPLIEEQRSKFFDPAMKVENANERGGVAGVPYDLTAAVATFRALDEQRDVFRSKDLKPFRRALFPIVLACRTATGLKDHCVNVSGEISNALNLRQWEIVHHKLVEMKRARLVPKLGAIQRWVRQCGDVLPKELAIFLLSRIIDLTAESVLEEEHIAKLNQLYTVFSSGGDSSEQQLQYATPFVAAHRRAAAFHPEVLPTSPYPVSKVNFTVDSCVLGPDRRPPSSIDMNIYRSKADTIRFDRDHASWVCTCGLRPGANCGHCKGVYRDEVEGVTGAILLTGVLSPLECAQFIENAEMLGYYDDAVEGIEALVWIADDSLLRPIFDRCKNLLPQTAGIGKNIAGINPRLRLFRYGEGAVYRPHIDGSWTASGDASLATTDSDEIHSYYTFLIYLNGGFEGGGTTFFVSPPPSCKESESGCIMARSVKPVQGSILCFPHGVVEGSLVHEGSVVVGNGKKYVIRTDLMFS